MKAVSLCSVLILSILLHSCSSVDKNALPVPIDAAMVMHVNTKSLTSKLSWEDLKKTDWYSMQKGTGEEKFREIMQNPDTMGIDTKEDLVFFVRRLNSNDGYFAVTGRLKDAAAFEAFNKKLTQNAATVKDGEINMISLDERAMASWTGNKFLYVFDAGNMPGPNMDGFKEGGMDDSTSYNVTPRPPGDLRAYTRNLFKLEGDSMLLDDDRYSSLIKQDGDVHFWVNAEYSYGKGLPMGMLSMLKVDKYIRETVTATTLSFENGKMAMRAKMYSNKEMTSLFKKYEGDKLNTDLLQRIPSDNVAAVLAMNYKPEGIKEFLKLGGLDGMLNGYIGEMGITLDDFIAANKGDLLVAVTDFRFTEYTVDLGTDMEKITSRKPAMNIVFATSIGNKAAFDKLVAVGKKATQGRVPDTSFFYNMNNEWFVGGSNQQIVDQYLKGGNRNVPYASKISGHPIGLYIDLQKFMTVFAAEPKDSTATSLFAESVSMWQDVVMTGGEFKDGGIVQDIEVNLVDRNTNSLKQLSQYFDRISMGKKRGF